MSRGAGPAAASARSSCAQCNAAAPAQRRPCSLNGALIRCGHCNDREKRPYRGLIWRYVPQRRTHEPVHGTAPRGDATNNQLHIVASLPSYRERVTFVVEMAACADPAVHPHWTVSQGARLLEQHRGGTARNFTLQYQPADWFARAARRGFAGIGDLFFPAPTEYQLRAATCGSGPTTFAQAMFRVFVYPDDEFKLTVVLPAYRKTSTAEARGTQGDREYQELQRQRARNGNVQASQSATVTSFQGGPTIRSSTRSAGTGPGRTVEQGGGNRDVSLADPAGDRSYGQQAARGITLERAGGNVTDSFGVGRFVNAVVEARAIIAAVLEFFRGLGERSPQVGWRLETELELMSGRFELAWGWKENPNNRFAWRSIVFSANMRVVRFGFKASFGVQVLRAVAKIELDLEASLTLSGRAASTPSSSASFQIRVQGVGNATLRVLAGWEGTLAIEGYAETGLELTSIMDFRQRLNWSVEAHLKEGKGAVKVTVIGIEWDRSTTFWERRRLGRRQLMGTSA